MPNLMKKDLLRICFVFIISLTFLSKTFEIFAQSGQIIDNILPMTDCYDGEKIKETFVIKGEKNEEAYEMMNVIVQQDTRGRAYDAALTTLIDYVMQELPRSLQIGNLEAELRRIIREKAIYSSNFQAKKNEIACVTARFLHAAYLKDPSLVLNLPKHYDFYKKVNNTNSFVEDLSNMDDERNDIVLFYNTLAIALVIVVLLFLFVFWLKNRDGILAEEMDKKIATAVGKNEVSEEMNQKIANLEQQQAKSQNEIIRNGAVDNEEYLQKTKETTKKLEQAQ